MKYYYVTYSWQRDTQSGYGDFVIERKNFYVKAFKDAAAALSGQPARMMQINVMEINKKEFLENKKEFESQKSKITN